MEYNISELASLPIEVIDGDRGKNYPHQDELLDEGSCLFLSATNVTKKGFVFDDTVFISEEKDRALRNGKLNRGDIVITTRGTVGNVAFYDQTVPYDQVRINSGMLIIRCHDGIEAGYLYYVLRGKDFQNQIKQMQSGSAQPQLPKSHFVKMKIPVPSLDEQKHISQVLTTFERNIQNMNQINRNLETQLSTLYKAWFIDFINCDQQYDHASDIDFIPDGWQNTVLGKVTVNVRDRVGENDYTVLSAVRTGHLKPSNEYFSKQVFSKDIGKYIVVKEGDFAYNPARINIGSIGINDLGFIGCVSPVYVVFHVDETYSLFFQQFFKTKKFNDEVILRASGSVRQSLNYNEFGMIPVIYPPKNVAEEYNKLCFPIIHSIKKNSEIVVQLENLRDTVAQDLLSTQGLTN